MTPPSSPISGRSSSSWGSPARAAATTTPTTPSSHDPCQDQCQDDRCDQGSEVTQMPIKIQPESAQHPGGHEPGAAPKARPWWMRPGFHTALVGAVVGYLFGHWLGSFLAGGYQAVPLHDNDDFSIVLRYALRVTGIG